MAELVTELKNDPDVAGLSMLGIKTDWVYFLRMHNTGATDATVTVRIWLAARDLTKDRRNWIEMDKFVATVPAGVKKVVARGGWQSTVVRRKSVDAPMTLAETKDEFQDAGIPTGETFWCECGLPYRLLLPRGTAAGMPARFLVLLTDAHQDGTVALATPQCGSVLYCGKTDNTWPDKQEMGFPFHRPFAPADDPVFAHFDPMPNAAWRDVSIRCEDKTNGP
jgi:tyrosinase